jgi:arylsulfatase A-like enzyme
VHKGAGITTDGVGENDVSDKPGRFADLLPLTASERRMETISTRRRAAAVYAMDRNIGRLIRSLKRSGEWDRTVFVFWSDNGYFQGEHNRISGKIHVYEPSLRVPMLITGPGMRGGRHDGLFGGQDRFDPVDVVDLSRTLVDIAGATPPHEPDGKPMTAVLRGRDRGWDEAVPYEAMGNNPARAEAIEADRELAPVSPSAGHARRSDRSDPRDSVGVRTSRWAYVRYVDGEQELYDLWKDPLEWTNLAASPSWMSDNEDVVDALQAVVRQLRYCTGSACHPRLPAPLSVGASTNAAATRTYWRRIAGAYGWSGTLR